MKIESTTQLQSKTRLYARSSFEVLRTIKTAKVAFSSKAHPNDDASTTAKYKPRQGGFPTIALWSHMKVCY